MKRSVLISSLLSGCVAVLTLFSVSCMGANMQQLRKRAAFDLNCSAAKLEIIEIDNRTRGVTGCTQRVTYIENCRACANGYPSCDCTWVLNGDGRTVGHQKRSVAPASIDNAKGGVVGEQTTGD